MFNENLFRSKVVCKGMTLGQVAEALMMNQCTISRKLKNHGSFTREEIGKLVTILDLSEDDVMSIFFAEELAET